VYTKKAGEQPSPFAIIGTRLDKVSDPRQHEAISTLLHDSLSTMFGSSIILNHEGRGVNGVTTLAFFPVSNPGGHHTDGVQTVLRVIEKYIATSPSVTKQIPFAWAKMIDELRKCKESYLFYPYFHGMAVGLGILSDEVTMLIAYLHKQGIVMWNALIGVFVILNPIGVLGHPIAAVICKHKPTLGDATWHKLPIHRACQAEDAFKWDEFVNLGIIDVSFLWKIIFSFVQNSDATVNVILYTILLATLVPISHVTLEGHSNTAVPADAAWRQLVDLLKASRFIVTPLLPLCNEASRTGDNWGTGVSYSTCVIVFTIDTYVASKAILRGAELASYGFIPIGTFERLIGKVLAWSTRTSGDDVASGNIYKNLLILRFGSQRFRLMILPDLNCIRLDVEGENPLPVYQRVMEMVDSVVKECMSFIVVFTMFVVPTDVGTGVGAQLDSSAVFVNKENVQRAVDGDMMLSRVFDDVSVELGSVRLKELYGRWLPSKGFKAFYDLFVSHRWLTGGFDDKLVKAIYDRSTLNTLGTSLRVPVVFLDSERLEGGEESLLIEEGWEKDLEPVIACLKKDMKGVFRKYVGLA